MYEDIIKEEYLNAKRCYGAAFNSPHEAYAVMQEEVEEAYIEFSQVHGLMERLWHLIKIDESDVSKRGVLDEIRYRCVCGMQELAQVAAMCDKAQYLFTEVVE